MENRKKIKSTDKKKKIINDVPVNKSSLTIVTLGASAGGLEAFEHFFNNTSEKAGLTYIVISHLDSTHVSMLPELLAKYSVFPVSVIHNGIKLRPNNVYVIPTSKNIRIKQDILYLVDQAKPHFSNLPIDYFLESLAVEKGDAAVAVIFSGAGADGTLGIRAIKREGGLVIVQDPLTARYDSMPRNAINSGLVDYILPAEKIALQISKWIHFGNLKNGKVSEELQQIFVMLRARTTHDFSSYKLNTICRRIERQMFAKHLNKISEYARYLRQHPKQIDVLFKDLLIGVTSFFRDPEAFEVLKQNVLLKMFKSKPDDYYFRVWVPGCSTGEEVYSVAIVLHECLEETKRYFNIQIFGTDIDLTALETARMGIYPESISSDINPARLKRFFTKENNKYRVKKEIREMVVFGSQSIIKDPPFTKLDIICCRNLLIYLSQDLQKKLLPIFHYSLKSKGVLFLGTSEAISGFIDLFKMTDKKFKIFEKKDVENYSHALINFPSISRIAELAAVPVQMRNLMGSKTDITNSIKKFLLTNYVPTCLVINKKGEILYTHGKVPPYFKPTVVEDSCNLFKLIPRQFKTKITQAIKSSLTQKKEMILHNLSFKRKTSTININIRVKPIIDIDPSAGIVCVIFGDQLSLKETKMAQSKYNTLNKMSKKILELEQELQYSKENLQTAIEELQSSNEELQSSNEELQSTNEEIETSKEELQSLNEELVIVNTELQTRIDQLASVNDDINNLFNSTEVSAIFLDNDQRIKRFTPKAQDLIHLIQTDIGRSISHFATNIRYENLVADAEEVLKSLTPKSFEVRSKDDNFYIIRILPYRTLANVIDGVVITFTDITAHKESEKQLKQLNNQLQRSLSLTESILDSIDKPLVVLSVDLKIVKANQAFCETYEITLEEMIGKYIYDINNKWNMPMFKKYLVDSVNKQSSSDIFDLEPTLHDGKTKKIKVKARPVYSDKLGNNFIILTME